MVPLEFYFYLLWFWYPSTTHPIKFFIFIPCPVSKKLTLNMKKLWYSHNSPLDYIVVELPFKSTAYWFLKSSHFTFILCPFKPCNPFVMWHLITQITSISFISISLYFVELEIIISLVLKCNKSQQYLTALRLWTIYCFFVASQLVITVNNSFHLLTGIVSIFME